MVKVLLENGASLADKTTGTISRSMMELAISQDLGLLDLFMEQETEMFFHTIKNVVWTASHGHSTPLTLAIKNGLGKMARQLLSYGAPLHITLDSSLDVRQEYPGFIVNPVEIVKKQIWQPILCAATYEMPGLVMELLDRGADPKVARPEGNAPELLYVYRGCKNIMDIVQLKIVALRGWRREDEKVDYRIKGTPEEEDQLNGKADAVTQLLQAYEAVEARLIELGLQESDLTKLNDAEVSESQPEKRVQFNFVQEIPIHKANALELDDGKDLDINKLRTLEEGYSAL